MYDVAMQGQVQQSEKAQLYSLVTKATRLDTLHPTRQVNRLMWQMAVSQIKSIFGVRYPNFRLPALLSMSLAEKYGPTRLLLYNLILYAVIQYLGHVKPQHCSRRRLMVAQNGCKTLTFNRRPFQSRHMGPY